MTATNISVCFLLSIIEQELTVFAVYPVASFAVLGPAFKRMPTGVDNPKGAGSTGFIDVVLDSVINVLSVLRVNVPGDRHYFPSPSAQLYKPPRQPGNFDFRPRVLGLPNFIPSL